MFAKYLFVDDINTPRECRAVSCPTEESVQCAIRRLDSKFVRNVILAENSPLPGDDYPFRGTALSIGGSGDRFVVEYCNDRGDVRYLLREGATLGEGQSDVMRGQMVSFDNAAIVHLEDALDAVTAFHRDGILLNEHRWAE